MNRKQLLLKAFQRGHLLTLKNPLYRSWIEKFIVDETRGDVGEKGDITTHAIIHSKRLFTAVVRARENGIIAGIEEAVFLYNNNRIRVTVFKKDGDKIKKGGIILKLSGTAKDLLRIERSALDLLQRMSGIATLTHNLISSVKGKVAIVPTRKTQWRYLDKKAVYIGHGLTHRLALWESILIKDAHLRILEKENGKNSIEAALKGAWQHRKNGIFIEIEVANKQEALKAAGIIKKIKNNSEYPFLIMLDNMPPKKIKDAIKALKKSGLYNYVLLEASGGINPANISQYAKTGVDVISLGYLTHSSHALDIKQSII